MNKLAKFVVLAGGVLGILGFFLPLFQVTERGFRAQLTTFALVRGIDSIEKHVEALEGTDVDERPETRAALVELNAGLAKLRPLFIGLYVPAALLLLFGMLAIGKASMGRFLGFLSLLAGAGGIGIWILAQDAISQLAKESDFTAGIGMHLIMVSGVFGAIAGLVALISPDRDYENRRYAATVSTRGV